MSLSDLDVKQTYAGDGSTTTFAIPFDFIKSDGSTALKVYLTLISTGVETLQVEAVDYTLTPVYNPLTPTAGPNNVEFTGAPSALYTVTIIRTVPLTQPIDIINSPTLFSNIENGLDQLMRTIQQVDEKVSRAIKFRKSISSAFNDKIIPEPAAAITVIGFDVLNALQLYDIADLVNLTGALAVANNLSDVADADASLVNLGIAPWTYPVSHAVTLSQAATNLTGEAFDALTYLAVVFEFMILQSTTVFATGTFSLHYRNAAWELVMGETREADGTPANGVTFSVSTTGTTAQLKAAESGVGNATVQLKKHYFFT